MALNQTLNRLYIITKKVDHPLNDSSTQVWTLGLIPAAITNYFWLEQTKLSQTFQLGGINMEMENVSLTIRTNSESPVALALQIQLVSQLVDVGVILGGAILLFMYAFIVFEVAHRTVVTMLAATWAIGVLAVLDERPSLDQIITWIDIETLTLLFAMMLIVSILSETGVFNYLGFWAFRVTGGRVWPLMATLCALTAVISAVLDNVTTILLMTPVIIQVASVIILILMTQMLRIVPIQLCESICVDPRKVLMANVIFSNIGGAATAIGDPPNVLIASDPTIQVSKTCLIFTKSYVACALGGRCGLFYVHRAHGGVRGDRGALQLPRGPPRLPRPREGARGQVC